MKEEQDNLNNTNNEINNASSLSNNGGKKNVIIAILLLIILLMGGTLIFLFDKGIISFNKTTENNSKKDTSDNIPSKKDSDKKEEKEDKKSKKDENQKEENKKENEKTISNYTNAKCVGTKSEYGYPMQCTLGNYTYTLKSLGYDDDESIERVGIYNKDGVLITEKNDYPDGSDYVSYNNDGTVIKQTDCKILKGDHIFECDYERYSYEGKKISNLKNLPKIIVNYDNYILFLDNNHIKLADYEGNIIKGFDFDLKDKYTFHSLISGWYTENNKKGIYLVIEDTTKEYGTKGAGIEYYYEPSTGEIGTIETEGVGGYAKPVLYLYPKKNNTKVTVTFGDPKKLTTTYPKYKDSWKVTANKNGDLTDKKGNYYYGLYWEEKGSNKVDFKEGYYVTKENAIEFLEEKLKYIGLNDRERNEFIMYWLPILEKNKKSVVYFELTEERQEYNELKIEPKPDSLLRVAIHVKKVDKEPKKLEKQHIKHFNRKGFAAVEWGGVVHK